MFQKKYAFKSALKRISAAFFDGIGSVLSAPFRRDLDLSRVKKILVVRLDHLGDVVMTRPALAALHSHLPNVQIDLLVSSEWIPLFEDAREVREVMGLRHHWFNRKPSWAEIFSDAGAMARKIRSHNYDLAIDFRGDLRNLLLLKAAGIKNIIGYGITGGEFLLSATRPYDWDAHQVQVSMNLLECLNIPTAPAQQPFAYSGSRKWRFWNSLGKELNSDTRYRVAVHAGAGLDHKRWPEENFRELAAQLAAVPGLELVLIGSSDEKKFDIAPAGGRVIDLRGRTELRDLPVLFDACHLFIGNDSGPAHVAAAQGISMISIFSTVNPQEVWKPWTQKPLEVLPHPGTTPEQVFEKTRQLLNLK